MNGFAATADITRPANTTAYDALDVVGGTLEFKGMGPMLGGMARILSFDVRYDVAAIPSGLTAMRLHLFKESPTAITDNAAFNLAAADRANYLGYVDTGNAIDLGATLQAQGDNINKLYQLGSTLSLFGQLQTIGGWTPAGNSETLRVRLQASDA